jgi:hypothetical protein
LNTRFYLIFYYSNPTLLLKANKKYIVGVDGGRLGWHMNPKSTLC